MSMTNKYHKVLQISRIEVNVPFLPMVFLNNHHWGLGQLSSPRIGKVFMSHLSNKLGVIPLVASYQCMYAKTSNLSVQHFPLI